MSEDGDSHGRRLRENATAVASTVITGIWLAALLTGQGWWLGALILGYAVVVPIVALLFGDDADREEWWDDWSGGSDWNWETWVGTKEDWFGSGSGSESGSPSGSDKGKDRRTTTPSKRSDTGMHTAS